MGIGMILSTAILLAGCAQKATTSTATTTSQTPTTTTATTDRSVSNFNACTKSCDIVGSGDALKKDNCNKMCNTRQKLESNDINDCNGLGSGDFVTKDICIQEKAIRSSNPSYCDNIENDSMKDTCYIGLSKSTKDQTLCEKIKNPAIKTRCTQK